MLASRFSFLGIGSNQVNESLGVSGSKVKPTLSVETDKDVYRPGDFIFVTLEVGYSSVRDHQNGANPSVLVEKLSFEVKGVEKLEIQWFSTQKSSPRSKGRIGIVPTSTIQTEIYWKEMDGDSEWIRANDEYDNGEDGYDSSRDEISSVSSYLNKGNLSRTFGSSSSLNSGPRLSMKGTSYNEEGVGSPPKEIASQLSAAVVSYDSGPDGFSPGKSSDSVIPSQQLKQTNGSPEAGALEPIPCELSTLSPFPQFEYLTLIMHIATYTVQSLHLSVDSANSNLYSTIIAAERFTRGRSYNIRMDDQVLLRFSPKNSDSTYYFSDKVSVTLETSETINRRFVHPSRRNSPTHTKVQSDHHEVVADLIQTSFLFSIPTDGPMSFTTPRVSVQWILRFEFLVTPKDVDLSRYEHPLLIREREKCEWVLPITVHAPPPRTSSAAQNRGDKLFGLEPSWDASCERRIKHCLSHVEGDADECLVSAGTNNYNSS
ncbi:hypothetical protein Bca4012_064034 [Brassica carinata]